MANCYWKKNRTLLAHIRRYDQEEEEEEEEEEKQEEEEGGKKRRGRRGGGGAGGGGGGGGGRRRRRSVANDLAEYAKCFLFIYANINSFLLPAPMPQSSLPPEGSNCAGWARLRKPGTSHGGAGQHPGPGCAN